MVSTEPCGAFEHWGEAPGEYGAGKTKAVPSDQSQQSRASMEPGTFEDEVFSALQSEGRIQLTEQLNVWVRQPLHSKKWAQFSSY